MPSQRSLLDDLTRAEKLSLAGTRIYDPITKTAGHICKVLDEQDFLLFRISYHTMLGGVRHTTDQTYNEEWFPQRIRILDPLDVGLGIIQDPGALCETHRHTSEKHPK